MLHRHLTLHIIHLYGIRHICFFCRCIHHSKYTLCSGQCRKDRVYLHGDFIDRAAELSGIVYKYRQITNGQLAKDYKIAPTVAVSP